MTKEQHTDQNSKEARPPLRGRGHSHILKLEVVLEGVSRDEPQLAGRDGAGKVEEMRR